jgi:DNA-binding transcriptional ArsR family regulator
MNRLKIMKLGPSDMFKILGVDTRIRIIELLKSKGPLGVKKISGEIGITPAAVSQHLKVLKHAGLVRSERKGYWIPYLLDEEALENCCGMAIEVCSCRPESASKFKEQELKKISLTSLMTYKKEIEEELQSVQKRIDELQTKKK